MTRKEASEVLGLSEYCTDTEVSSAFRRLAMACHPDMGGTAYLFRKISEARDALKNNQPTAAGKSTGAQRNTPPEAKRDERKPTWREIVLDPNFYVPYEQFLKIVHGREQSVRFGKYTVVINERDLSSAFIKAKIPVTVEIRTWENWFKRIFGKPEIAAKEMEMKNKFPFSYDFIFNLTVRLHTKRWKYYKLTVKILDQEFIKSGRCLAACQSRSAKTRARISELDVDLCVSFMHAD